MDTKLWTMVGTEGTGEYRGIATEFAQIGIREFEPGSFRIRVEPLNYKVGMLLVRDLDRKSGWKQPGDGGQYRFSRVVSGPAQAKQLFRWVIKLVLETLKPTQLELSDPAPDGWVEPFARTFITGTSEAEVSTTATEATVVTPSSQQQATEAPNTTVSGKSPEDEREEALQRAHKLGIKGISDRWGLGAIMKRIEAKRAELVQIIRQRKIPGANLAANWGDAKLVEKAV